MEKINLLKPKIRAPEIGRTKRLVGALVVLLVLYGAGALWYFQASTELHRLQRQLTAVEKALDNLDEAYPRSDSLANEKQRLTEALQRVGDALSQDVSRVGVAAEVWNLLPNGVSVARFSIDKSRALTIDGSALRHSNVSELMSNLLSYPMVKKVHLVHSRRRTEEEETSVRFLIKAVVVKRGDDGSE